MFAKFSGSESTHLGIQESEDISTKSIWISLPAGNSLTDLFTSTFSYPSLMTAIYWQWGLWSEHRWINCHTNWHPQFYSSDDGSWHQLICVNKRRQLRVKMYREGLLKSLNETQGVHNWWGKDIRADGFLSHGLFSSSFMFFSVEVRRSCWFQWCSATLPNTHRGWNAPLHLEPSYCNPIPQERTCNSNSAKPRLLQFTKK